MILYHMQRVILRSSKTVRRIWELQGKSKELKHQIIQWLLYFHISLIVSLLSLLDPSRLAGSMSVKMLSLRIELKPKIIAPE